MTSANARMTDHAMTILAIDSMTGPITHLHPGGKVPEALHDLLTPPQPALRDPLSP